MPREVSVVNKAFRSDVIQFLEVLRHRVGVARIPVRIDFSQTVRMSSDGTILLLAEIHRLNRLIPGAQITGVLSEHAKVNQVLQQVGILRELGIEAQIATTYDDVVHWRSAHGVRVEGEKYENILRDYDGALAPSLQANLFAGITEAMTNVLNHAYKKPRSDGLPPNKGSDWWMFSQEKDGDLFVVFCDLGAGIPVTLPFEQPNVWKRLVSLGKTSDAEVIDYAIRDSVSRTRKAHRGKGLGQIVNVIRDTARSEMAVVSNRGAYSRLQGSRKRLTSFSDSILGTLIYWRVPLTKGAES